MIDKKGHPIRIGDTMKFHEFGMVIRAKVIEKDNELMLESTNGKCREMHFFNDTLIHPSAVVIERKIK